MFKSLEFSKLEELRKMAPPGNFIVPLELYTDCKVMVMGNVRESVTRDWFAIFPDSSQRKAYERALISIVEGKLGLN